MELRVRADDTLVVRTAASDFGQGLEALLASIVSASLHGFPSERISWEAPTTLAPDGGSTGASRQSTVTGNALFQACQNLMTLLRPVAAEQLDCHPDLVQFNGEQVTAPGKSIGIVHLFQSARDQGVDLTVEGAFTAPPTTVLSPDGKGFPINQFGYAVHVAHVQVDTTTGEVAVISVNAFHDAGSIVNPIGAAGQVEGALVMGMGFALSEDYQLFEGKPVNVGFTNYLIPSIADTPDIRVHFLTDPATFGPLGVKGLAEAATATIAPAIANAIYDATGARVTRLPATPDRVRVALDRRK